MAEADCFGKIFVQVQGAGDGARDLGHFEGVSEAGDEVVSERGDEDLCLVFEAAKAVAVDDAVAVALEIGTDGAGFFGGLAPS